MPKRIISLIAAILIFACILCACADADVDGDTSVTGTPYVRMTLPPTPTPQFVAPTIDLHDVHGISVDKTSFFFGEKIMIYIRAANEDGVFSDTSKMYIVPEGTDNTESACEEYNYFMCDELVEQVYAVHIDDSFEVGNCQIRIYDDVLLHSTPITIGNITFAPTINEITTEGFARFDVSYTLDADTHDKSDIQVRIRVDGGKWRKLTECKIRKSKITLFDFTDMSKTAAGEEYPKTMKYLKKAIVTYKDREGRSRCYVDVTQHTIEIALSYNAEDGEVFWTTPFPLYK